ncbi:MAG: DNA-binding protein [Clostridia bacterium]|nr:DNA-binding protein [Clostridia bacterium]MDE6356610.1 DNA-binding protein [Clostridia bacterium]
MDKFTFIALWDIYRGLLTPTQSEITDMYLNMDLTVSEIAEQKGVSRQAVSECLKGCKKQLEEYEEKLGLRQRINELSAEIERLKQKSNG